MSVWRDATPAGSRWAPSRYALAGALIAALIVTGAALAVVGIGGKSARHRNGAVAASDHPRDAGTRGRAHAKATQGNSGSTSAGTSANQSGPTAVHSEAASGGSAAQKPATASGKATATGSVLGGHQNIAAEQRDPEEANSHPAPASLHHSAASSPAVAAKTVVAPGAASNAQIEEELEKVQALERKATEVTSFKTVPGGESIAGSGKIPIPSDVPAVVQRVIAGANAIADFPYVYGGGHASFVSDSYDCSGSVSYALAAGGLLKVPETSGQLESWGAPGPGKWITVYANAGHTYMYVNIGGGWMLYDTAGRSGVLTSRWQPTAVDNEGYVARHWPGL